MLFCIVELVHMRSFLEPGTIVSYVAVLPGRAIAISGIYSIVKEIKMILVSKNL